jgi:Ni/Co efflux regulator RcnB
MKTLILAAMAAAISFSTLSATAVPSQAASVVITTDNDNMRHRDRDWRHHHRDREQWRHWKHARKCQVRIEKRWRHGHMVVRKVKICRSGNGW